jgi:hypothetical protein
MVIQAVILYLLYPNFIFTLQVSSGLFLLVVTLQSCIEVCLYLHSDLNVALDVALDLDVDQYLRSLCYYIHI